MTEANYGDAAAQVLDILYHTNKQDVMKIPENFIKFLINISSKGYKVKLNHSKKISEMDLSKEAKELLGFIYITWWCDKEEKEKYKELFCEKQKIKKK